VRRLLAAGAGVDLPDRNGRTPLERCLIHCSNATIERVAEVAQMLLDGGAERTPACAPAVVRVGEGFEFHRPRFNPETVDATSAALDRLYALFDVAPVARRLMHDGVSPITVEGDRWEDRFERLWDLLVPSSGAAATVQGEVVRIAGRIRHELDGNGGVNWDADYRRMADAWLAHVGTAAALEYAELAEARALVAEAKARGGDMNRLCALATAWVGRNQLPIPLPTPRYAR